MKNKIEFKKLMPLLFVIVIPVVIIYFMFDSFNYRFLETMSEKITGAMHRKIDGVDSELEVFTIFKYVVFSFITYFIISYRLKKRELIMVANRCADRDVILLVGYLFKVSFWWGGLYGLSAWSQLSTMRYFNSSNLIMFSVLLGVLAKAYNYRKAQ